LKIMKTKVLSGLICCLGIFSANAQTITAPTGQNLTITNPVDVTGVGATINIPSDGAYKIGGTNILRTKTTNILVGDFTGSAITTGNYNYFAGVGAGNANTSGNGNAFFGLSAGLSNTTGSYNNFSGLEAGRSNTSGDYNVFFGTSSGYSNTVGASNIFFGSYAGRSNINGNNNLFFATSAGYNNVSGSDNVFLGQSSGIANTTGSSNICIGTTAGNLNTTGSFNTYIGNASGGIATISNATAIGANATATLSNTVVLGNAATTITGAGLGAGLSGLKFANLTSGSAATPVGGNKVLSVDGSGNVVLVALTSGTINSVGGPTGPVAEKTWKDEDGYLYNNSTNGVVINGTGFDGNSLIVKGGVLSKEVSVKVEGAESWPDYVFKPSYKRLTLDEVEKFININGHLPNVASAAEMAKTGNNLGQTDVKLMEKVEELTLYLLEMKKANEAQNAEIQNLKKQVKSLRKK
jgi:trimeric autotransporter adhesin